MSLWPKLLAIAALASAEPAIAPPAEPSKREIESGFAGEQNRSASWQLAQHRKLTAALAGIKPERKGIVDAYVVVAGLDDDPVFGREAAEAARVLSRRFDAQGRTILIAAGNGAADPAIPTGTPGNLAIALAAIAERMNRKEDVLILYATAHGAPRAGIVYKDGDSGFGNIAPTRLAGLINELAIERRLVIISACYAGQFVLPIATPDSAIIAAADENRTSFGCEPGNDWTFFGDALVNHALRSPLPMEQAVTRAFTLIGTWEFTKGLTASQPRSFIGEKAKAWLALLEARMPKTATPKVGRPATD